METIVCYGDSNTLGFDPRGLLGGRYDRPWPRILETLTGCRVKNLGYNGLCFPRSPAEFRIPEQALEACSPVRLLIVMLGTNDVLEGRDPLAGLDRLLAFLSPKQTEILVLSPPRVALPEFREAFVALPPQYAAAAQSHSVRFCDTQAWELPLGCDGVHLTEEAHLRLAQNLYQILEPQIRRNPS